jgi:hypothetical protein
MYPGYEGDATIYALATGAGKSAVAIIRISGSRSSDILRSIAGGTPSPRIATLRPILNPQTAEILDHAVVFGFPHREVSRAKIAPNYRFTGPGRLSGRCWMSWQR